MKKLLVFVMLMLVNIGVYSQDRNIDEIHSAMVYNIIKYVNWPNDAQITDFVIGVYGDDDVYKILNTWYNDKPKGTHKMKIKKIESLSDVTETNVVYIGKNKTRDFDAIYNLVKSKPILTISDSQNLGRRGSAFNLKVINEKLKFEINQNSIQESGLRFHLS